MRLPVFLETRGHLRVVDDEQILCIILLSRLRKIERPREHRLAIDDYDLVMRDRVLRIDVSLDALMREKICR